MSESYLSDIKSDAIKLACFDRGKTHASVRFEPRLLSRSLNIDGDLLYRLADTVNQVSHGCVHMNGYDPAERDIAINALKRGEIELSINPQSSKFDVEYVKKACQSIIGLL